MTQKHKHGIVVIVLFVSIVVLAIAIGLYGIMSLDEGIVSRLRFWWGLRENLEVPPPIDQKIPLVSIPSESEWDDIRSMKSQNTGTQHVQQ